MAGTSKGYSTTEVHQGPGDLWVLTAAPDDTAQRLTLATDLTPDSGTHTATHLGIIESGITTMVKPKIEQIKADQADAAVDAYTTEVEAKLEVELKQSTAQKLQRILGVGTYSTGSGYRQCTFGGTSIVPTACVAAISARRDAPTKAVYSLLYKAVSLSGFSIQFGRAKAAIYKATFLGLADLTRTAGRQIGVFVKQLTAPTGVLPTAKDYTTSEIQQGPADLWIIGTAPVDGTPRLTLAADLTPDATAHPSSIGLGMTQSPVTLEIAPKLEPIKADQADAPVDMYGQEMTVKLSTELTQSGFDKLTQALGLGTGQYALDGGGAYEQITFGGQGTPAFVCVAAIAKKRSDATKVWVACLFRVISTEGITFAMSRGKANTYKVTFEGQAELSRTAGKQIGTFYETV